MSAVRAKRLSSLFLSAAKTKPNSKNSSSDDSKLQNLISSVGAFTSQDPIDRRNKSQPRHPSDSSSSSASGPILDDSPDLLEIPVEQEISGERSLEKQLDLSLFGFALKDQIQISFNNRKEVSRRRKEKWVFKSSQEHRINKLVNKCAEKLGTDTAFEVFGKLGKETGLNEYNSLIQICIKNAKNSTDEEVALQQIHNAILLFKSMKEQGFQLKEETYGLFLAYLIEMGMVEEFHFFCEVIQGENPCSLSRLGYYEMLLWIRVEDEVKIKELCNSAMTDAGKNKSNLLENYLLALCEGERKEEILQLLEVADVTKFSSVHCLASIFNLFGKLMLESFADNLFMALKAHNYGEENFSNFIYSYVVSIPNLAVEDVISNFKKLHMKLEVSPSCASYERLIVYFCNSHEVHVALDFVDEMCELGLDVSMKTLSSILHYAEETFYFNLVHRVYSVIRRQNLQPNSDIVRHMITLFVRMKNFDGAYGILNDLEILDVEPKVNMYNAIMGGYFREKNIYGAKKVLKLMDEANIKRDSVTYSYLINNCECEDDINKYFEEMKSCGIDGKTKHVLMALINAYASFGQFEKAKKVVSDMGTPDKSQNEIKSVLAQALSENDQWFDALDIYKQIGSALDPKAVISLIEHVPSYGELSTLLQLLEDINGSDYWADGCNRIILYCIRYKHLSPAIDLLKQLRDKFCTDEMCLEGLFDEVFCLIGESDPTYLQMGLDLLSVVKNDFGLIPPRKCLDFLLHACVNAKDLHNSKLIWNEYKEAGLPHNILNYLIMYQAYLAAGEQKAAKIFLARIPKDDPDIKRLIRACGTSYREKSIHIRETQKNTHQKKREKNKK